MEGSGSVSFVEGTLDSITGCGCGTTTLDSDSVVEIGREIDDDDEGGGTVAFKVVAISKSAFLVVSPSFNAGEMSFSGVCKMAIRSSTACKR